MDAAIWQKSQRKTFPFNINLSSVILLAILTPLVVFLVPFGKGFVSWSSTRVLLVTVAISVLAYHVSCKLITGFKDILCQKGLFGKDLNKEEKKAAKFRISEIS